MKILYFTDKYTFNTYGTKRSIYEEVKNKGYDIIWVDKSKIISVLNLIDRLNPDQIWLSHSGLVLPYGIKKQIKIPIIGFGFSDPYYFSSERFKSYDVYVTNHYETFEKYKTVIPVHYNQTACDFKYHKNLYLKKDIDVSLIGCGLHPRFKNKKERLEIVKDINNTVSCNLQVYGSGWFSASYTHKAITGSEFLNVINRSKIGLDIQDFFSPLAHRMFEYSACATPVITRERDEVFKVFEKDKEILTYKNKKDLKEKLNYYLKNADLLTEIGVNAANRCKKEHDVSFRVAGILDFLKKNVA